MVCEQRWQMSCLSVPWRGMQRGAPPPPELIVPAPMALVLAVAVVPAVPPVRSFTGEEDGVVGSEERLLPSSAEALFAIAAVVLAAFVVDDDLGHVGMPEERPAFSSKLSIFWV